MQLNTSYPSEMGSKLLLITLISLFFAISGYSSNTRVIDEYSKISWNHSYQKDNFTYIPGTIKIDSRIVNIFWKIGPNNNLHLYTTNFDHNEELYPRYQTNGFVRAFRRLPSNKNEPSKLQQIFLVKTANLHQALKKPVSFKPFDLDSNIRLIDWKKSYTKNQADWLPGKVSASFGTLNLYWKRESSNDIKLITLDTKGGAERASREEELMLLANQDGTTTIFKIQQPLNNRFESPVLIGIVTVNTENLNDGLAQIRKFN